jgi:glucokinase
MRLGIDVGGTKCLALVLDDHGGIVHQDRSPTPDGTRLIDALVELVERARVVAPVTSVGLGIAGLVTPHGVIRAAANLTNVVELPAKEQLHARVALPVAVDNDNTCAALAEWQLGAGRGISELLYVGLGTGIGGGFVMGGGLRRGAHGFAGEIGHVVIDPAGPPCPCGRRGCWERYASGSALGVRARAVLGARAGSNDLIAAAVQGDPLATAELDEFARWVAIGLVSLTNVLDPARIVLGGGLGSVGPVLFDPVRAWLGRLLYAPEHRPHPELVPAALGERSGAIGAALLGSTS